MATAGSTPLEGGYRGVLRVDTQQVTVILGQNATVRAELHSNETAFDATVSFVFQTWNIVANISDLDLVGPEASFFVPLVPVKLGDTVLMLNSTEEDLE